jgi:arylsulfatase A-like enzyme/Flp pilus assembly protein TadD
MPLLFLRCAPAPEIALPSDTPVVLISIDTLRSDRLPAYGYAGIETPHLDELAVDGVTFERVYAPQPLTLPSHATMFTGLRPPGHGVRDNLGFRLDEAQETLAERLLEAGYRTAGVVSSMVLRRRTGIAQGFEVYRDDMRGGESRAASRVFSERPGNLSTSRAIEWLRALDRRAGFFLFLHLNEPHTPYNAPDPFAGRYPDPYDAEIAFADSLVGELIAELRTLDLYESALIVVTSDHGEGLGDHVEQEHGLLLYRETLQVPLLVKLPAGQLAGRRVSEPAGLIDLMPTLLGLLGRADPALPGRNLFDPPGRREASPLYGETFFGRNQYGWSELRSVIRDDLHYIAAPRPELYDLANDPGEQLDLLGEREVPEDMLAFLAAVGAGLDSPGESDAETRERLASLGYVGRTDPTSSGGPDPKDHIADAVELWESMRSIGRDENLGAERRALELLQKLGVRNETLYRLIANNLMSAGRPRVALEVLQRLSESNDPATLQLTGQVATTLGRLELAAGVFERILEIDPAYAEAHMGAGIVLLAADRPADAAPHLRRAVELDPGLAESWNGLGAVEASRGDWEAAARHWRRALEIDAELADAWFNLGLCEERLGNRAAAVAALQRYAGMVGGERREEALVRLRRLAAAKPAER